MARTVLIPDKNQPNRNGVLAHLIMLGKAIRSMNILRWNSTWPVVDQLSSRLAAVLALPSENLANPRAKVRDTHCHCLPKVTAMNRTARTPTARHEAITQFKLKKNRFGEETFDKLLSETLFARCSFLRHPSTTDTLLRYLHGVSKP